MTSRELPMSSPSTPLQANAPSTPVQSPLSPLLEGRITATVDFSNTPGNLVRLFMNLNIDLPPSPQSLPVTGSGPASSSSPSHRWNLNEDPQQPLASINLQVEQYIPRRVDDPPPQNLVPLPVLLKSDPLDDRSSPFAGPSKVSTPTSPAPGSVRSLKSPPSSPSPVSSASSAAVRCASGTKRDALQQCKRPIKSPAAIGYVDPDANFPRYCYQHLKEKLQAKSFRPRSNENFVVEFANWIPSYLHEDTQVLLRNEMQRAISPRDKEGYIYCFELRDPDDLDRVHLKVGRSDNASRRIGQWIKSCESEAAIVRGCWPEPGVDYYDVPSLSEALVISGVKGKNCHRLERLIHLELADISLNETYLTSGFDDLGTAKNAPKGKNSISSSTAAAPSRPKKLRVACTTCKLVHREIFTFVRATDGPYKGREWEGIVKRVIDKWGLFVECCT